jgi:ankyrin repeat protein
LKAELILNVLEHLKSTEEVEKALNSIPRTYDGCYEFTLKQIERKEATERDLAFKILTWLSHVFDGLTVTALQEALSVQIGDEKVDKRKLIPVDDIISVCSGLVVTYTAEDTQKIRLLHETASTYLKNNRLAGLAGHKMILKACLAYLSLPKFSELCFFRIRTDERERKHAFYKYAAKYWPMHAIQGDLERTFRDQIINFLESTQRQSADEFLSAHYPSAWHGGSDGGKPWTDVNKDSIRRRDGPVHAAAAYGLPATVRYLIQKKGYQKEQRNSFGETPLHRAAQVGSTRTMEELIIQGADLRAKVHHHYLKETTALMLATLCQQIHSVRVLLNHGMDVNLDRRLGGTFDANNITVPLHMAASTNTELTRLLLDHVALVQLPGICPQFPEVWPSSLHFAVFYAHAFQDGLLDRVNLLLDRGASINSQSSAGNTVLHMAILAENQDLVRVLLQKGANVTTQNKKGKSPVQLARERGHLLWIEEGVPTALLQNLPTGPPLHQAIWSRNYSLVNELLEAGHDIAEEDQEKVTPWEYCILSGDVELAQILVDHMKKHNSTNHVGNTAFEIALKHMTAFDYTDERTWEKTVEICIKLLPFRRIFDPTLEFTKVESPICNYKKTFFIWAAELGRTSQVKFLLSCGSNVNAVDTFGSTGLHYAVGRRNFDMVNLLIQNGANLTLELQDGRTPLIMAEAAASIPVKELLKAALSRQLSSGTSSAIGDVRIEPESRP